MSAVSIVWFLPADTLSTVTCILKRTPKRANFKILSTFKKFHLYQKALYLIFQGSLLFAIWFFLSLMWVKKKKKREQNSLTQEKYILIMIISLVIQDLKIYLVYCLSEYKIWHQTDMGSNFSSYHFLVFWLWSRDRLFELHLWKGQDKDCIAQLAGRPEGEKK